MSKELSYDESKQEKARLEGVITGLMLALEVDCEPGFILQLRDEYKNILQKFINDPDWKAPNEEMFG